MIRDIVKKNRSYRRFYENVKIEGATLRGLVDLARHSASGGNLQPLKYMFSNDPDKNSTLFKHLIWAAYLKDWPGPEVGERPSAYVIVLCDTNIAKSPGCDHGIACQSILLGATEMGLGGCIIGSIRKKELHESLDIPNHLDILLVVALGKPKETVIIEELGPDGDIKYWRDSQGGHHVPKRKLDDIIIG